ncbi:Ig-like domain-containing protein [Urbifossiella limnaea]|uniref:Cadherin domain-containing protein n=1 Tax=Urbifossiella limnaea TaxID=2528023 RepID=A0A517XYN0_9BACT|nr:Ig-like domain-containing protein [Urbifossiella limnaea]QDU22591.1 hypothetical protein ETAA1_45740 [Urbifossiella limnaea]
MTVEGPVAAVNAALGALTFTPATNFVGSAIITVVSDDQGGSHGAALTDTDSFTGNVNPVNDAPSFSRGADVAVTEDSGLRTFAGWARGVSTGPADEVSQTVSFIVSNNHPALFTAGGQPAVSPDGTLTFTPAPDANPPTLADIVTVTVQVRDNGGGANTSAAQTFTIQVAVGATNSPPTATAGPRSSPGPGPPAAPTSACTTA